MTKALMYIFVSVICAPLPSAGEHRCSWSWHARKGSITKYAVCVDTSGLNKSATEQFCTQLRSGSVLVRLNNTGDSTWIREELLVRDPYHFSPSCSDISNCGGANLISKPICSGMDDNGKIFKYTCVDSLQRTFACEKLMGSGYIDNVTNKFYVLHSSDDTNFTWINASQYCLKHGYEIVQLRTIQEQANLLQKVKKLSNSKMFPLGLKKIPNSWHWTNGHSLHECTLWTNWAEDSLPDETLSENEACAMVDGNSGVWLGTECSNGSFRLVICQVNSSLTITQNGKSIWCYFSSDSADNVKEICFYSGKVSFATPNDCSQIWPGSNPVNIYNLSRTDFLSKMRTFCEKIVCDRDYNIISLNDNKHTVERHDGQYMSNSCYFTDNEGSWNSADCTMPLRLSTVVCQYDEHNLSNHDYKLNSDERTRRMAKSALGICAVILTFVVGFGIVLYILKCRGSGKTQQQEQRRNPNGEIVQYQALKRFEQTNGNASDLQTDEPNVKRHSV